MAVLRDSSIFDLEHHMYRWNLSRNAELEYMTVQVLMLLPYSAYAIPRYRYISD